MSHSNTLSRPLAGPSSDEIDLRELALSLWQSRAIVFVIALVTVLVAGTYIFLATPVYHTQAKALPPPESGLAAYNKAFRMSGPAAEGVISNASETGKDRLLADVIPALTPQDAYRHFMRHAASVALRRAFFEEHYLPAQNLPKTISKTEYERQWVGFNRQLTVALPRTPADNDLVTISWQGTDPSLIADWTNLYLHSAIETAQKELADNLSSALSVLGSSLDDQLVSLRSGAQKQREQQIARLREALSLAESIGLETPPDAGNLITSYSGETAYMRGARALRNEIVLLQNRKSDDPFIPEIADIFKRQALLKTVTVIPEQVAVARVDETAAVAVSPIKPRKALILALALVLGTMGGICIVLIRNMFRR